MKNRSPTNWNSALTLAQAFRETRICQRRVHALASRLVRTPPGTPASYRVSVGPLPIELKRFERNIFSTLFHAVYLLLDIPRPERQLYGSLNHLFRIWVTGADNLLDHESKPTLPLRLPRASPVMSQVVAIMVADRVLARLLQDAVAAGTLTPADAFRLSDRTLQILLPSAAQEGAEEGGITEYPEPGRVLSEIHPFKTGILFRIPFLGPETVCGPIDPVRLARLKAALTTLGLGCQLLDDVRDVARDFVERRHNYLLSTLAQRRDPLLLNWAQRPIDVADRIYSEIPEDAARVARMGTEKIRTGLTGLQDEGLKLGWSPSAGARLLLQALDLKDLKHVPGI